MAVFPRLAIFVAINIKPVVLVWVVGKLMRLPASARCRRQKLAHWIMRDDAINLVRLDVGVKTGGDDLAVSLLNPGLARLRSVFEGICRIKSPPIHCRVEQSFSKAVVGFRPQIVSGLVAIAAAFRPGVIGEDV